MVMGNCPVQVGDTARAAKKEADAAVVTAKKSSGSAGLAVGLGGLAAVIAAVALANRTQASGGGGGTVTLDPVVMQLLTAIAAANADMLIDLGKILAAMPVGGGPSTIVVVTKNVPGVQTESLVIDAVGTRYQLPSMSIPDGYKVLIKAWPAPFNAGIIYVAQNKDYALDINHIVPLAPGEFISYGVEDASSLWVSGTAAGDRIAISAEKA